MERILLISIEYLLMHLYSSLQHILVLRYCFYLDDLGVIALVLKGGVQVEDREQWGCAAVCV